MGKNGKQEAIFRHVALIILLSLGKYYMKKKIGKEETALPI